MKVSKEQAAENRELILTEAARLFRERGVDGVGVDALTKAAGLTHGSLYSQFGSKEKLLAEALSHGFEQAAARAANINRVEDLVSLYLSLSHRDNPGKGCFLATLGNEGSRQSKEVRSSFTKIVLGNVTRIASLLSNRQRRHREDEAIAIYATMVGAMVLSRAVDNGELSDRILSATRAHLLKDK
jgi:TetR/AcrR family transcriptional regulator, transcriptional repressor for nem operon